MESKLASVVDDRIKGLQLIENFISKQEGFQLIEFIKSQTWAVTLSRRTQQYGYRYSYTSTNETPEQTTRIPSQFEFLIKRLVEQGIFKIAPDQIIVNEYTPGQGISKHIDHTKHFGDTIASLSLASTCVMDMINYNAPGIPKDTTIPIPMNPSSLIVLNENARYNWFHSIDKRKTDVIGGKKVARKTRISLTFRNMKNPTRGDFTSLSGIENENKSKFVESKIELKTKPTLKTNTTLGHGHRPIVRIAIIGSAGRGADANKMSFEIFNSMVETASYLIQNKLAIDCENSDLILVSGGSAWSDHVAVKLWQADQQLPTSERKFSGIHLYLPCELEKMRDQDKWRFRDTATNNNNCAQTLNYLHEEFSGKMQIDSITELFNLNDAQSDSSKLRVKTIVNNKGFFARNADIAKGSDRMIAFTWGNDSTSSSQPTSGGTLNTWTQFAKLHKVNAHRIHVSLPTGLTNGNSEEKKTNAPHNEQKKITDFFKPMVSCSSGSGSGSSPSPSFASGLIHQTASKSTKRKFEETISMTDSIDSESSLSASKKARGCTPSAPLNINTGLHTVGTV